MRTDARIQKLSAGARCANCCSGGMHARMLRNVHIKGTVSKGADAAMSRAAAFPREGHLSHARDVHPCADIQSR